MKFDHAYDIRGNLSALCELAGTKTFTYDTVERLASAARTSPPQQIESHSYDAEGNRIASHISAGYSTDAADRVLENADNLYTWSPDGQPTRRQPKAANATAWDFSSSFRARTNQMRLDAIRGSDGRNIAFAYDPLEHLAAHQWPAPHGNDELYYNGPDVAPELRHVSGGDQWARYVLGLREGALR
ncbi:MULTISPECIES: hypothetical protein [Methylocystis]|uniref:hypothetical protein n=1 Tax=Methylocystis TaxID=133 RepID=UPI0024B8DFBA|nr:MULTISPECIES: hypothetical protein [Methylocystis]MDJ0450951.1 hypothetical protein [Methylocystis sp. JR02]